MESSKKTSLLERKHIHISQPFETCSIVTTLTSPLRQRPIYPIFSAKGNLEHAENSGGKPQNRRIPLLTERATLRPIHPSPRKTALLGSQPVQSLPRGFRLPKWGRSKQWRTELSNAGNKLDTPAGNGPKSKPPNKPHPCFHLPGGHVGLCLTHTQSSWA